MYKLTFYVPPSHVEQVKTALFENGAGRYQGYDYCSWQVLGEGQFRPLAGSQPYIGKIGVVEKISEYKVEMICAADKIQLVVQTLLKVHPYEQPAFEIYKILNFEQLV